MNTPPKKARAESARKGGSVSAAQSPAKAAALAALHESRRGVPVNPMPAKLRRALTAAAVLIEAHGVNGPERPALGPRGSIRAAARSMGVTDRALRRWLAGSHHPAPRYHTPLMEWVEELKTHAKRLSS